MSKWFAKDNIKEICCSENEEKDYKNDIQNIISMLSIKHSENIPSLEKKFIKEKSIEIELDDPKILKPFDSYDKVKLFSKKHKSETKILEILKYFNLETENILQINCKTKIKDAKTVQIDKYGKITTKDVIEFYDLIISHGSLKNKDSTVDEAYFFNLLFQETIYSLRHQNKNGSMIIRMYNSTTKPTIQLIHFLSILYSKIFIIKPRTSRDYSSERFLICLGYKNTQIFDFQCPSSKKMYIKDIFYESKIVFNDIMIKNLLYANSLMHERNKMIYKNYTHPSSSIITKQNILATEFCNAFYDNKYSVCQHKIQGQQIMIICSYCDSVVIL